MYLFHSLSMMLIYCILTVILSKKLVMATEQCVNHHFKPPFYPCEDIYNKNPESYVILHGKLL